MCIVCLSDLSGDRRALSSRLLHTHVPFYQPPDLTFRVATRRHAVDEVGVLLLGIAVLLRAKADHRQQFLNLTEHTAFNHVPDLLIAGPGRIFSVVVRPGTQAELHNLIPEVLGIGDPSGLFDFCQFLIEQFAVQQLTGIGVLEVDILDPGIGVRHVAIEQVLSIVVIRFQIRLLDLIADEFGVTRCQFALDELQIPLFRIGRHLFPPDRLFQNIH